MNLTPIQTFHAILVTKIFLNPLIVTSHVNTDLTLLLYSPGPKTFLISVPITQVLYPWDRSQQKWYS